MSIRLSPQAAHTLRHMAPEPKRRVKDALKRLVDAGRLDVKRLKQPPGGLELWRLRVGDWRVVYVPGEPIRVIKVFHRSDGYGWMEREG